MRTRATIDRLLHDADRKVMGANCARQVRDFDAAGRMDADAARLYRRALKADSHMEDPAWTETGNRDVQWLIRYGFADIAALRQRA